MKRELTAVFLLACLCFGGLGLHTPYIPAAAVHDATNVLASTEVFRLTDSATDLHVGDTHLDDDGHVWVAWRDTASWNAMLTNADSIGTMPAAVNISPENDGSSDNDCPGCILRDNNGTLWLNYGVGSTTTTHNVYVRSYTSGTLGDRHQVASIASTNWEPDMVQTSAGDYYVLYSASNSIYTANSWHAYITHSDNLLTWTTPTQVTSTWGRNTRLTIDGADNLYALIDNDDQGLMISHSSDGSIWSSPVNAASGHFGDAMYSSHWSRLFVVYCDTWGDLYITESDDGVSWTEPWLAVNRVSSPATYCRICEDPDGKLIVTYMDHTGSHNDIYIAVITYSPATTTSTTTTTTTTTTSPTTTTTTTTTPTTTTTTTTVTMTTETFRLTNSATDLHASDTHVDDDGRFWVAWCDTASWNAMLTNGYSIGTMPAAVNISPENDGSSDNDCPGCILRDSNGTLWLNYGVGSTTTTHNVYVRSYTSGTLGDRQQTASVATTNWEPDMVQTSAGDYYVVYSASNSIYTASSWHAYITHSNDLLTWTTPTQVTSTWGRNTRLTIDGADNLYALIDRDQGLMISHSSDGSTWSSPVNAASGHFGDLMYSSHRSRLFVVYCDSSGDLYITESDDRVSWTEPWLAVDRVSSAATYCRICEDPQHRLIVTYMDRTGSHNDIYIVRISSSTGTTSGPGNILAGSAGIIGSALVVVVVVAAVGVSRMRRKGATVPPTAPKPVPPTAPASMGPMPKVSQEDLVLGALKSYPRVSMSELSTLLKIPTDQVRMLTLALIAKGSVTGAFDRSMDEFVSVSATRVGRELKESPTGVEAFPKCPHCGATLSRPLGIGETSKCESCGKTLSG